MNELKTRGLPSGAAIKESACNAGDLDLILGSGRFSGEGNAIFLPGKSHGQRSLAGYSPWGHRIRHDCAWTHKDKNCLNHFVDPVSFDITGLIRWSVLISAHKQND